MSVEYHYGQCPECGDRPMLDDKGRVIEHHILGGGLCPGSGQFPKEEIMNEVHYVRPGDTETACGMHVHDVRRPEFTFDHGKVTCSECLRVKF